MAACIYSARIFIDLLSPEGDADFSVNHDDDDDGDASSHGHEENEEEEECILFIEFDVDDVIGRVFDLCLLYLLTIAVQIFFYVRVAQRLWSSQVLCSLKLLNLDL